MIRVAVVAALLLLTGCANVGVFSAKNHHAAHPRGDMEDVVTVYGFNHYRDLSKHNGMLKILEVEGHAIPRVPLIGGRGAFSVSMKAGVRQIKVLYVYSYDLIDYYSYHTYTLNLRPGYGYFLTANFRGPGDEMRFDVEEVLMHEVPSEASI